MGTWREAKAADGRTYYYDTVTHETRWDKPADYEPAPTAPAPQPDQSRIDASWQEAKAPDSGRTYYYNSITKATSWEAPEAYIRHQQNARPGPAFVAGGGRDFGEDTYSGRDRRRDDKDSGLPQKPSFEGRGGGMPWEQRQENQGFRGPMPTKTDEPEYGSFELAEEAFFKLLRKHNISSDTTWEDALRVVVRERDYRALKDPKERKQAFEKYCAEARAQERGKEKERRERLREDFRKMLATHDDIKHYTRWKTARPIIEREAVFKGAGDEDERRQMFDEYVIELKKQHASEEIEKRKNAMHDLQALLQALIISPDTKWREGHETVTQSERFTMDDKFRSLSDADVLIAFDTHIKGLERIANDKIQQDKRMQFRRARQARDNYKQMLNEMRAERKIKPGTRWQDFHALIANDARYRDLIGVAGSGPLDLFWDVVEDEERVLRSKRNAALDVLEEKQYEMTLKTSMQDFVALMRSDPRTEGFNDEDNQLIYDKLLDKIRKRFEEDRVYSERHQRKALDLLRSVLKTVEPPIRADDRYEDVSSHLQSYEEFRNIKDEALRKSAFEKHVRRLRDKEDELERERARRDRDREHRNGSRRDHERDRDRRHRERTPEVDAYEADRRKAQADRERQYRKASFGLTPPPRERERERDRRDDRDDRYRRHDRQGSMSIYDRERREREMERERNYISRADPRDKGRALDYGDEDVVSNRSGSVRKRRDSEASPGRRDKKRPRHQTVSRTPEPILKDESPALQSGSEEGEIEEV